MNKRIVQHLNSGKRVLLAISGLMAVAGPIAVGVPILAQLHPRFEVASIKLHSQSGGIRTMVVDGGPGTSDPGRVTYLDIPLIGFIAEAYGVDQRRARNEIVGAPDWAREDFYDLVANVPPGANGAEVREMMRNLLIERFALRAHLSKQDRPLYQLVVAKGGPKMKAGVPNGPERTSDVSPRGLSLRDTNTTMAKLAGVLSGYVGRRVQDKTGLAGAYSVEIEFAPPRFDLAARRPDALEPFPSVFTVIQRLGLKLEETTGPVDVVFIDHINRTTSPD